MSGRRARERGSETSERWLSPVGSAKRASGLDIQSLPRNAGVVRLVEQEASESREREQRAKPFFSFSRSLCPALESLSRAALLPERTRKLSFHLRCLQRTGTLSSRAREREKGRERARAANEVEKPRGNHSDGNGGRRRCGRSCCCCCCCPGDSGVAGARSTRAAPLLRAGPQRRLVVRRGRRRRRGLASEARHRRRTSDDAAAPVLAPCGPFPARAWQGRRRRQPGRCRWRIERHDAAQERE